MAYMNGLDPDGVLIAGSALKLPTGAPVPTTSAAPSVVAPAPPAPTPGRVGPADIAMVANRNGVPASLASAISFFLVSNLATWLFQDMYPKTYAGLLQCYTMAIPFFRGTFASDLIYTPVLFSVPYALALIGRKTAESRVRN